MGHFKSLLAYQKAYQLAIQIFNISRAFPNEERYGFTSQIRNSSRSVCANLAESWKRRQYKDYFMSKLNDAETENAETEVWLDMCLDFKYISPEQYRLLLELNNEVGKLIYYMIKNPEKFL